MKEEVIRLQLTVTGLEARKYVDKEVQISAEVISAIEKAVKKTIEGAQPALSEIIRQGGTENEKEIEKNICTTTSGKEDTQTCIPIQISKRRFCGYPDLGRDYQQGIRISKPTTRTSRPTSGVGGHERGG